MMYELYGSITEIGDLSGDIVSEASIAGEIKASFLQGLSAYEVAVENGFEGTEEEWLESLYSGLELQITNNILQWRRPGEGDDDWKDLCDLTSYIDYDDHLNKPQIESISLEGNKTFEDLGLVSASTFEIESILQS